MWTGPAALRPYDGLAAFRWWCTFMEYGNGIMGDMCIHMLDTALDARPWLADPRHLLGGIYVQKEGKSNIADTQTATFEYPGLTVTGSTAPGARRPTPIIPGRFYLWRKRHAQSQHYAARFIPQVKGEANPLDCVFEREKFPEDVTEKDIELNAAPATRPHMLDFLAAIDSAPGPLPTSRGPPPPQLHPGEPRDEGRPAAALRSEN